MPLLSHSTPKYRHHKASGQAIVTLDGRDFYLNGTRIHVSAVPLDNGQIGARADSVAEICRNWRACLSPMPALRRRLPKSMDGITTRTKTLSFPTC